MRRRPRCATILTLPPVILSLLWASAAAADPLLTKAQIDKAASRIEACLAKQGKSSHPKSGACVGLIKGECEAQISAGGEAAHATCSDNETAAWDVLLNRKWAELSTSLDEQRFAALKAVQKLWLSYRDARCKFVETDDPSMMGYMNAADCRLDETSRRVLELRELG